MGQAAHRARVGHTAGFHVFNRVAVRNDVPGSDFVQKRLFVGDTLRNLICVRIALRIPVHGDRIVRVTVFV